MGGDIHTSFVASAESAKWFIKCNHNQQAEVLASEYASLLELERLGVQAYPRPIKLLQHDGLVILIMAYHQLDRLTDTTAAELAKTLAAQHNITHDMFGWHQQNYIGSLPQANEQSRTWPEFFQQQRLLPQIAMAMRNGLSASTVQMLERLAPLIEECLQDERIKPCLLHGDLWSGNAAYDRQLDRPVLFDPAPYYGDPEVDLAMTELFGGFPADFYRVYRERRPEPERYQQRKAIYNLYHALNHFNHFGAGYESMVQSLGASI